MSDMHLPAQIVDETHPAAECEAQRPIDPLFWFDEDGNPRIGPAAYAIGFVCAVCSLMLIYWGLTL